MRALPAVFCVLLPMLSACGGTSQAGLKPPPTGIAPVIQNVSFTGGDDPCKPAGEVSVKWYGVAPPYKIKVDLPDPAEDSATFTTSESSALVALKLPPGQPAGSTLAAKVSVTDARGLTRINNLNISTDSIAQAPPVIDNISVEGTKVSVSVHGSSCGDLSVSIANTTGGIAGTPSSIDIDAESGTAVFDFSAPGLALAAVGTATFTVEDGIGQSDTKTSDSIEVQAVELQTGSLYAIPLANHAQVGDTVKVLVVTGPLEFSLQSLGGISLIAPSGCEIDAASLDYGLPPAETSAINPTTEPDRETVDGLWTQLIEISGFEAQPDPPAVSDCELPDPFADACAWQFHITPQGQYIPAGGGGAVFSINLHFSAPGTYKLDFRPAGDIPYCWYSDPDGVTRQWTDISNSLEQCTIAVSPAE